MKTKEQIKEEIRYGNVYTIEEFIELYEEGWVSDDDGYGYFHDGENRTPICIWNKYGGFKKDIAKSGEYRYICWYNR